MAADLLDRLEKHYAQTKGTGYGTGGTFVREVGLNNGSTVQRRCDAVHVGYTSASGRILRGHEVKVSRADWLAELAHPGKADFWADACHEWWLVMPDAGLVREGELPPGWGLMVPDAKARVRFKVVVRADRKPDSHAPSWLAIRSVMARLDTLAGQGIADRVRDATDKARQEIEQRFAAREIGRTQDIPWEVKAAAEKWGELVKLISSEEGAMSLNRWQVEQGLRSAAMLTRLRAAGGNGVAATVDDLRKTAADLEALGAALSAPLT